MTLSAGFLSYVALKRPCAEQIFLEELIHKIFLLVYPEAIKTVFLQAFRLFPTPTWITFLVNARFTEKTADMVNSDVEPGQ